MGRWVKFAVVMVVLLAALAACKKKTEAAPETPPAPAAADVATPPPPAPVDAGAVPATADAAAAPDAVAVADAPAHEATWEEQVAASKAISPTVAPQTMGDKQITADVCTFEGTEILGKSTMDIIQAIAVTSDHKLYLVDADGKLMRFTFKDGDACVLVYDPTFGTDGKLAFGDRKIETLNVDDHDKLYASAGMWEGYRLTEATTDFKCETDPNGYLVPFHDGKWALSFWSRPDLEKVTFTDTGCTGEKWEFDNPFSMVQSVGFMNDLILVGGNVKANPDDSGHALVVAYDQAGKEQFRVGSTAERIEDSTHCWVHGVTGCPSGICVLDSNCRKMVVWTNKGEFTGKVDLTTLFGLNYPWYGDFQVVGDVTYIAAGDTRKLAAEDKNSEVVQGFVFRVHGL